MNPSFKIAIWEIKEITRKNGVSYRVRWRVGPADNEFHESYSSYDLAEGRRSELITAKNHGEPFDLDTGLPLSEAQAREEASRRDAPATTKSVFEHLIAVTDRRWDHDAGNTRRGRAEANTDIAAALLPPSRSYTVKELRAALRWAFNTKHRRSGPCPAEIAPALEWINANSPDMTVLADEDTVLAVLNTLSRKLDGDPAAASTFARKRAAFHLALEDAVGPGKPLDHNPLRDAMRIWKNPMHINAIDPKSVINPRQAEDLLEAVVTCGPMGEHLQAYFGAMYYSGLRPGESARLGQENLTGAPGRTEGIRIRRSAPVAGSDWTDTGRRRDDRQLKHRADNDWREPPCPPQLREKLDHHVARFGFRPDGRLIRGAGGGDLSESVANRYWAKARRKVLTPDQLNTGIARRPYSLRHACLSYWLIQTGGDAALVADWAGNSVKVLLETYAKVLSGRDRTARKLVEKALHHDLHN